MQALRRGVMSFARAVESGLARSARAVPARGVATVAVRAAPRWRAIAAAGAVAVGAAVVLRSDKESMSAAAIPLVGVPGTRHERSFIAIKPDGTQRQLVGEIISRFEARGYKLVGIKMVQPSKAHAEKHYDDLKARPFFPSLVNYFSSGPVVAMVWEGMGVIAGGRKLVGATNPNDALPGTVRGDFCTETGRNVIHASDAAESAAHEIALWFQESEVTNYELSNIKWISEKP